MKEIIYEDLNRIKNTTINKTGITLIMLVITIAVLIILASAAIVGVGTLVTSGKKTAFATDLKSIEDAVEVYYNDNGVLPMKDDTTPYVLTTLTALSGDGAIELGKEITENEDTTAQFYEVDLDKINSSGGTKGKKSNGEGNDIFVVSSNNKKVYYVKGEKIGSDMYFSLTSKLTKGTNFKKDTTDTSTITTVEAQGMKITKDKKDYTNELNITLETTLKTGETINYIIAGVSQVDIIIPDEGVANISLNSTTIIGETLTAFNSATDENKTIVVNKKNSEGVIIATVTMNISNLDLQIGTVTPPNIKSYDKNNVLDFNSANVTVSIASPCIVTLNNHGLALNKTITFTTTGTLPTGITAGKTYYVIPVTINTFKLSTSLNGSAINTSGSQSGIHTINNILSTENVKEIRYEYITKWNSAKEVVNYYTVQPTINKEYMLNSSKKSLGLSISIPKNIKTLAVSIVDKAGNISEHITVTVLDSMLTAEVPVKEYVKDGLMVHYDGINNTGNGHSNTSTIWKDLSGNGRDAYLSGITTGGWIDKGFAFKNTGYIKGAYTEIPMAGITQEVIVKFNVMLLSGGGDYKIPAYIPAIGYINGIRGDGVALFYYNNQNWVISGYTGTATIVQTIRPVSLATTSNAIDKRIFYTDGVNRKTSTNAIYSQDIFNINEMTLYNWATFDHDIYSVRLYNRALTADEIKQNYEVDKERFGL